jgi:hypothetical protein
VELIILTRPVEADEKRILDQKKDVTALLLGRAVLSPPESLGGRTVWVLREEVKDMGLEGLLSERFISKPASEIVEQLMAAKLLNL